MYVLAKLKQDLILSFLRTSFFLATLPYNHEALVIFLSHAHNDHSLLLSLLTPLGLPLASWWPL